MCKVQLLLYLLTFTLSMDSKPYSSSKKVGYLYRAQHFLTPESFLYMYKFIIRPCMEYCSHIWGGAPRSCGLDLLDRVKKRVVSLVGSGFSSDLQAMSHRRDVSSLSLFYKYYYGKCSSELADLVPPKRVTVRSTSFSEQMHRHQALFLAQQQPIGTPSLMNAFHQITISQHSRGGLTSSCCWSDI